VLWEHHAFTPEKNALTASAAPRPLDELVRVTVYKRGAVEVVRRLAA
jgi:hypothetical protein